MSLHQAVFNVLKEILPLVDVEAAAAPVSTVLGIPGDFLSLLLLFVAKAVRLQMRSPGKRSANQDGTTLGSVYKGVGGSSTKVLRWVLAEVELETALRVCETIRSWATLADKFGDAVKVRGTSPPILTYPLSLFIFLNTHSHGMHAGNTSHIHTHTCAHALRQMQWPYV